MISYNEAINILSQFSFVTEIEKVEALNSLNRILAIDLVSDVDMPRFDRATMDGFAIHSGDINKKLEVIEIIQAGNSFNGQLKTGQALRIMTGAPVPENCDMVVPIEQSHIEDGNKVWFEPFSKTNISPRGEDFRTGDTILFKGQIIDAQHIATMASIGCIQPIVYQKPKVAILVTGNELVEPDQMPVGAKIRNSNSWLLSALVSKAGGMTINSDYTNDDLHKTIDAIKKSLKTSDVLCISGGISSGDFDFIPKAIELLGGKMIIRKVNIQPGKPFTFAIIDNKPVFGIPGNPVAALVTFEFFIKPFINRMSGNNNLPLEIHVPLERDFKRDNSQRKGFYPAKITTQNTVQFVEYHGSAHLAGYTNANVIAIIEPGINKINEGEPVRVRLL
jgi:molybdopterin molybdotransferase